MRRDMTAVLVGFAIAVAIGATGMGGGVLTVPILMLYMGVPPAAAVGTALLFSTAAKLPAAGVYLARHQVDASTTKRLLAGGLPGVALGSLLIGHLAMTGARRLLTTALGAIVMAMAVASLLRLRAAPARRAERPGWLPWLGAVIGVEVGFSSAGAGALGTAGLLRLTALTPARVVGTDLCFGLLLSALGGGLHAGLGAWDRDLLVRLVLGGVPGALAGALLAGRAPQQVMRLVLLVVLFALGSQLLLAGLAG